MSNTSIYTIGTDIEFFLQKEGKYFPSVIAIQGTKSNPELGMSGMVYHSDNAAVEFAIPPVKNKEEWLHFIKLGFTKFSSEFEINTCCSILLDKDTIEDFPTFEESGCSPDFFIKGNREIQRIVKFKNNWRYAGGHIHLGVGKINIEEKKLLLELYNNIINSWLQSQDWFNTELEAERNKSYGEHTAYRDKPYGIEIRQPSNAWAINDPAGMYDKIQEMLLIFQENRKKCIVLQEKVMTTVQ